MADSIINFNDPSTADVVIFGVDYDRTSSFGKGADLGPAAILECLHSQIELWERLSDTAPAETARIAFTDSGRTNSLSPEEMVEQGVKLYAQLTHAFVVMLGGEHSVTNIPLTYYKGQASQITVLQLDAHADLREDDSDYNDRPWGKFAHCAVMRRALEHGYNLVQVGLRAYSKEEASLFTHPRVRAFPWSREEPSIAEIIAAIPTEDVYLTIDADGLDPSITPATGTPVPGGLSWYFTCELLLELFRKKRVVAADLVEVAPREADKLTEYSAAQLIYSIIGLHLQGKASRQ